MRRRSNKKVCGIGINDANYATNKYDKNHKLIWRCPFYQQWFNMINRVYGKTQTDHYDRVSVCEEWLTFSKFRAWMQEEPWEGRHLDKDILGDKTVYSPLTCVFVSKRINVLITEVRKNNSSGVPNIRYKDKRWEGFYSYDKGVILRQSFHNKRDAINFWIDGKIRIIKEEDGLDMRVYKRLIARYEMLREEYLKL